AKYGLIGLNKVVELETAGTGITANAVCPGWVLTPLVEKQIADIAAQEKPRAGKAEPSGPGAALAGIRGQPIRSPARPSRSMDRGPRNRLSCRRGWLGHLWTRTHGKFELHRKCSLFE